MKRNELESRLFGVGFVKRGGLRNVRGRLSDAARDLDWSSAVKLTPDICSVEIAIPWKTIADAGLDRAHLMADVTRRGRLRRPPLLGGSFQRLIPVPEPLTRPRTLSVRLHFAELADIAPGRRVFDVKLQGRTVVREFHGIKAARALVVELVPTSPRARGSAMPILSAIELRAQP